MMGGASTRLTAGLTVNDMWGTKGGKRMRLRRTMPGTAWMRRWAPTPLGSGAPGWITVIFRPGAQADMPS